MEERKPIESPALPIPGARALQDWHFDMPPTEDELPYEDGIPLESQRHLMQINLLIEPLKLYWQDRNDYYVNGDMFIYFSPEQVKTHDFRGPDVFVAQGVENRERKSWVVWQEGKPPDVVIELLSVSTAEFDKTEKKSIYQERLRAPEYFWYDPFDSEDFAGFALQEGIYKPLAPDAEGNLSSHSLGLKLCCWQGEYDGVQTVWLRWATLEGELLPTQAEVADQERRRAAQAEIQVLQERQRAEHAEQKAAELEALLAEYRQPSGKVTSRKSKRKK